MPSYSPDFTPRLKVTYRALGAVYSNTWRFNSLLEDEGTFAGNLAGSFYTPLMPLMPSDFQVLNVEWAEAAVGFFLPSSDNTLAALTGTNAAALTGNSEYRAVGLQFQGKTVIGNPWRITVQGVVGVSPFATGVAVSDNFRLEQGELTETDDVIDNLGSGAISGHVGNDAQPVIYKPYVNIVVSRYRIGRIRRFG